MSSMRNSSSIRKRWQQKFPDGIGQFARPSDATGPVSPRLMPGRDVRGTIRLVNALQHYAIEHTRLGIPIMFHEEGLHGYVAVGATSFPQAIALGVELGSGAGARGQCRDGARNARARRVRRRSPRWWMWRAIRAGAASRKPSARIPIWSANWASRRSKACRARAKP